MPLQKSKGNITAKQRYDSSVKGRGTRKSWEERNKQKLIANSKRYAQSEKGKETKRKWRITHAKHLYQVKREWELNTEAGKNHLRNQRRKQWMRPKKKYSGYVKGSIRRGIEFILSLGEFTELIMKPCVYCGAIAIPPIYNGIDRVDNSNGYVPGNIVPCCKSCNQMKSTRAVDDFISHIERIYLHRRKEDMKNAA